MAWQYSIITTFKSEIKRLYLKSGKSSLAEFSEMQKSKKAVIMPFIGTKAF